jgi:hypothetical protein
MNTSLKLAALVLFAAGAAVVTSASPSQAQIGRPAAIQPGIAIKAPCCQLATKQIATGAPGWSGIMPNNTPFNPVVVNPTPSWSTLPGSHWIASSPNAGVSPVPGGWYIYQYHLGCLCGLPDGVKNVPASLNLHIYADDGFIADLNGAVIAQQMTGYAFIKPPGGTPAVNVSTDFEPACDNVLTIKVKNWDGQSDNGTTGPGSPSGLDVFGTVSGYFQENDGRRCPKCPPLRGGPAPTQ